MPIVHARQALARIAKELEGELAGRENTIKGSRDVIASCSRAIIEVHGGDMAAARKHAAAAQGRLLEIKRGSTPASRGSMLVAEQELVEALALIALVEGREVPVPRSMHVSGAAYVLGLLDCIGELKRQVYERMRHGELERAAGLFALMNETYEAIYPLAAYDKIVKETRRKLDVARTLIEMTRAAVTEETRRAELVRSMRKIAQEIGGSPSGGAGDGIRTHELLRD